MKEIAIFSTVWMLKLVFVIESHYEKLSFVMENPHDLLLFIIKVHLKTFSIIFIKFSLLITRA